MIPRSACLCACHSAPGTIVHVAPCCAADEPLQVPEGGVVCGRCSAVVAAWRIAERGGTCHCCGEQVIATERP